MTSKPSRRKHHASQPQPPPQPEYESDFPPQPYTPPPLRTNHEMNLSVLRRYNPSITSILSLAANAVIYTFSPVAQTWEKSGVEGTLFVCAQAPTPTSGVESACLFVLNRRGLDNLILDLGVTRDVEVTDELLILRWEGEGGEGQKVMGVWIHDAAGDRERNSLRIQEAWERARAGRREREGAGDEMGFAPPQEAMGRRISLSELFGRGAA